MNYFPEFYCYSGIKENYYLSINSISYFSNVINTSKNIKYFITNYKNYPNENGHNISNIIENIRNKLTLPNDLTENNVYIHFTYGEWCWYYPNEYANLMKARFLESVFSLNDFFIKTIIE